MFSILEDEKTCTRYTYKVVNSNSRTIFMESESHGEVLKLLSYLSK